MEKERERERERERESERERASIVTQIMNFIKKVLIGLHNFPTHFSVRNSNIHSNNFD